VELNLYRFQSTWGIDAKQADVYSILEAVDHYPEWWPEVRAADRLAADRYRMQIRSFLPYDLVFVGTQWERDPQTGILSIHMKGDLEGFSRWTIVPRDHETTVTFDEQVTVTKPILRRLAVVGRPAFQWNHALMMRHCRAGLRACLAGIHLERSEGD